MHPVSTHNQTNQFNSPLLFFNGERGKLAKKRKKKEKNLHTQYRKVHDIQQFLKVQSLT